MTRRGRIRYSRALTTVAITVLLAAGCGGDSADDAAPAAPEPSEAPAAVATATPAPESSRWADLGALTPRTANVISVVDFGRLQALIGSYPGGDLLDDAVGAWFVRARDEAGAGALPGHLQAPWNRLDTDGWSLFLGRRLADVDLALSSQSAGEVASTVRFSSIDVRDALTEAGWGDGGGDEFRSEDDDVATVLDQDTVRFGAGTAQVITDAPGVSELLAALDDAEVHEALAVLEVRPLSDPDDALPARLVDAVGVRGAGPSAEAVTVAVYPDESDARIAADGITARIATMDPDERYAGSSVTVDGVVVTVVTLAADDPMAWRLLRNLLLVESLLD